MRCNVDLLKIIQVGITLADEDGQGPPDCSTWQFNFKFSLGCVGWLCGGGLDADCEQRRYVRARLY